MKRNIRNLMNKTELLSVECVCRMPEEEGQSNRCGKQWLHEGCVYMASTCIAMMA
jgi:hypothetical protein